MKNWKKPSEIDTVKSMRNGNGEKVKKHIEYFFKVVPETPRYSGKGKKILIQSSGDNRCVKIADEYYLVDEGLYQYIMLLLDREAYHSYEKR